MSIITTLVILIVLVHMDARLQAYATSEPGPPVLMPPMMRTCFHANGTVRTEQYGRIAMSQIFHTNQDARVLTRNHQGQLEYTSIVYWLHAEPDRNQTFLEITTDTSHRLLLTAGHLIYQTDCTGGSSRAVRAEKLKPGQCVFVNMEQSLIPVKVASIQTHRLTGIYAPITETGTIMVDDVLASCYVGYEDEAMQNMIFKYFLAHEKTLKQILPSFIYSIIFRCQDLSRADVPRVLLAILDLAKYFLCSVH